ncbi:DUF5977 domain-containing protein [Mucilaginibacter sp.]|uniref:DUF5977 domain-containing protein n=1 Tax=Mucilaginibacter sp. TaxID=1882438 RepID=UPI00284A5173|nr:DUF5977 domain-containing protein [Mucilaginibacter sp.]MDR3697702.1 DUF5977 domain-containing protein [Mucilaginibacter sp.]
MNLKLIRILIICSFFILIGLVVNAQSGSQINYFVPQPFPRSPTATALEKYGTYQINEFTGVPDISIPLYTIEAGGFQVPITLSYHASGIKVTDVASWVGAGWSVSSGGQVSRRAMGLPDDMPYGYLNGYKWQPGTYSSSNNTGLYYLENAANGTYDTKPDIFSYDFPGHGGKFFFDGTVGGNYTPRMIPYAPINVKYTVIPYFYTNPPPNTGLVRFNITDEHGNNYTFGDAATETTYSSSGGHAGSYSASTWKLERMVSQNRRDTISFAYQADTVIYPSADGEIFTVTDQITAVDSTAYNNASYSTTPTTPGNNNITTEKLPQQINFKNGKVVFELDPTVRQDINTGTSDHAYGLKNIKVYRYNYGTKIMELQKTIVFYKSYFSPALNPRLRLDSIQVLDKAGSIIQHYRFDYNTSLTLPEYTSYKQDYWGYYNGKANDMFTPKQTITYQPYSITPPSYVIIGGKITNGRNCDSAFMQAYVLTGIHYPSGGYSTFAYQTNQYYISGNDTVQLAGGLRIKSISSYDGISSTPMVKTYVYNSARPNFLLDYSYFSTSQIHRYYDFFAGGIAKYRTFENVRTYSSNPHCDLEAYDGATVVYPSVSEYIGTPGTNIGRTDYTFTDQKDATTDASMTGNLVYLSSFYVRGHLLSKNEYIHKPDGTYQIVKSTVNAYTAFPYTNYNDVGLAVRKINYNEGRAGQNPMPTGRVTPDDTYSFQNIYYYITSDDNYLKSTTTNIYDTNDTTKHSSSVVSYKFDNIVHQQVTRTYHTDSKGNTIVSRSVYPADYPAGNPVIDSMVNRNMQADAIEKYDTVKNVATGINAVVDGQLTQYKTGNIANTIVPSKISTLSVAAPLTNFTPSTVTSGNLTADSRYVQMISFDNYDGQNNITQYTPRNAMPTSIMWNYNYELPEAQVKNATNLYGGNYNIFYTSFEADNQGNWNYSGTPVTNPAAPTGSMVYPLSAGSVTSASYTFGTNYVLSLWSNNGPPTVYNGSSYLTDAAFNSANGWTYYEYQVPSGSGQIAISGSTSIDELRMYPANAQMTTYAYDPSGVRSISDTKGANSYFEYDFAQRLKNIKDWAGNIVKNYGYHMYDMTVGNQLQTATFTRNNCPPNTNPGSLTYTVPVNRYYSSTLASANADAIYDMNVNGQSKANANCGCPVTYITYALTNYTGLTGWTAVFSGISTPFNFPSSGTAYVQVPQGTYASVYVGPLGSATHTFTMGNRTPVVAHYATFNTVVVAAGSSDLTLSVQ